MVETATLAGGCFWCHDAIFRRAKGVTAVTAGYAGGHTDHPTYEQMHHDETGHAEAVQIEYDSKIISYETLLQIFWATHNPTTLNQDGANIGSEYRSEVFYHNESQKQLAEKVKKEFTEKLWDNPVVTKITPYKNFFPAEDYHQDYYNKNPQAAYCQVVINPKLAKFQEKFADWLED